MSRAHRLSMRDAIARRRAQLPDAADVERRDVAIGRLYTGALRDVAQRRTHRPRCQRTR